MPSFFLSCQPSGAEGIGRTACAKPACPCRSPPAARLAAARPPQLPRPPRAHGGCSLGIHTSHGRPHPARAAFLAAHVQHMWAPVTP